MAERVTAAVDALDQAKVNLAKSKQTAGVEVKDDAMTISEDDTEKMSQGRQRRKSNRGFPISIPASKPSSPPQNKW